MRKPGAMHKARWMAKVIYAIKMTLYSEQLRNLPKGTVAYGDQLDKLKDFVIFITHVYCDWWLKCQSIKRAPLMDLHLYKTLLSYKQVNAKIANSALRVLNRHLWYLTPEMVVFGLFDFNAPERDRQEMASRLKTLKPEDLPSVPSNRFGSDYGKPSFPSIDHETSLSDLLSTDSWFAVKLLNLDMGFLEEPVDKWQKMESFQLSASKVDNIKVINDAAERGVKLTTDYRAKSKSEFHFQNLLQVVEKYRKEKPHLRKKMKTCD